jgi:hypothetical protein
MGISSIHNLDLNKGRLFSDKLNKLKSLKLNCVVFKDSIHAAEETHSISVIQTNLLMLYREIIAVCSEIHTKHINKLCGQNTEFLNVKPGGT